MSLILEALKKAERQHRLGEVPGIGSSPIPDTAIPHRGRLILVIFGLALGMLLLGSYLGRPWSQLQPEPVPEPKVPTLPPLALPQQSQVVAPSQAPTELVPEPELVPKLEPEPEPATTMQPPVNPQQPVQQHAADPTPQAVAAVESKPKPEPAAEPEPVPARKVKPPPPPPPKQMSELPDGFVSNMPKLNIDIHSYDERPGRSYVLINMEKYHAGDYLAEGPLLSKILKDGVILEYMGERFILPIGNY